MDKMRARETTEESNLPRVVYHEDHRSSYHIHSFNQLDFEQMLNSITNDLDILLTEFCQLSYPEPPGPAAVPALAAQGQGQGHRRVRRVPGKKPMHFENCSAFGGSSTSGTLTSTDSNHSNNKEAVLSGTLTSTDSNASVSRSSTTAAGCAHHHTTISGGSCQRAGGDVGPGVALTRALDQPVYPDKQPSPSRSTSVSDLRQITVLERLTKTHPIWFLPTVARSGAVHLLKDRETGIFIVRKSSRDDIMALSVQFPTPDGIPNVDHYLIEPGEAGGLIHLQGSTKQFSAVPNLVAHYCDNKEDLPYRLILPGAIRIAKTSQELAGLAMLGQDFWTSSKFDEQSRSSSKSNLSDHSSSMNKSMSEPISITKTPVTAYSQSEPLIQNTPPKHSVIDFKSYLIKPKETLEVRKCTRSVSVNESVHTKCSFHERKQCNHVPVGHEPGHVTGHMMAHTLSHDLSGHVTQCETCLAEEGCERDLVLHWELQQSAGCQMRRNDSQVSVPYAKPDKGNSSAANKSNLHFQMPSDEVQHIPDEFYFRSNLSDKLSDYEDIWKNNYSESNVGKVQANIVQRLQPNLVTYNNNNNNNMLTNNIHEVNGEMVHRDCATTTVVVSESQCISASHISEKSVKVSNLSMEESQTSMHTSTTSASSNMMVSHHSDMSESHTCMQTSTTSTSSNMLVSLERDQHVATRGGDERSEMSESVMSIRDSATMHDSNMVVSRHSDMVESVTSVRDNSIMHDSIAEEDEVIDSLLSVLETEEKADKVKASEPDVNCNFMLGPLEEEIVSDTDSDGSHSNGCPSDEDAEADTEDVDDSPNISSVQTQTSPMWKMSPLHPGCVARKSVSTTMLTAMKSPVYAEPFDAIAPLGEKLINVPQLPKKMRRRSAPAVTSPRKLLILNERARLSPVVASHGEECSEVRPGCGCEALDEVDGVEQDNMCDDDEVFQLSPDSNRRHSDVGVGVQGGDVRVNSEETYEKAWEGEKCDGGVQTQCAKTKLEKPTPIPRKAKHLEKHEKLVVNTSIGCSTQLGLKQGFKPNCVEQSIPNGERRRSRRSSSGQHQQSTTVTATNVMDQIHVLENFDTHHAPSSPTVCKFPVYTRQISEDTRNMFSDGSTAEDMICTWNPELTLKPVAIKPFAGLLGDPAAMSEYDNLNNPSYISPSVASAGTIFCNPWENSIVGKLINTHVSPPHPPVGPHKITKSVPPANAPPPLPPPMDTRERIKAWQQSSQKYHSVSIEHTKEHNRLSMVSDAHQSVDAVTFGGELSGGSYDFKVSSNGKSQSEKTLVNERSTQSGGLRGKVAGNIPLYGADFREKLAPILANPPLLNKPDRNRNPDRKIRDYIIALSKDHATTFGSTIENFIQCTLESNDTNPCNITRNVRQFLNGIKNYLVKHGEGELEDLIERERSKLGQDEILNIDAIIEGALHVCVIQPLKHNIYRLFVNEYTKNGNLKLLSSNIKYARTKTAEEIGIRKGLIIPAGPTLEMIKHYFTRMQKSYSPLKKLENLLSATSAIYRCVTCKQPGGTSFGADDFLPMLIYVLVQCGLVSVEIEADYMWSLLHPSLLTGEGGYYLTSLSSAVLVLKNFRETQETSASQHQGKLPSISDMQGFIKIAIPDEHRDTIVWKTLPVRPSMTTKDVCSLIAHKFKITNPQDYGLYTLEKGEECKLMDMECPQGLKVERQSRGKECIFAYKRNAANIAWPKSVQ